VPFAQRRNRLTTHSSECNPVVTRRMTAAGTSLLNTDTTYFEQMSGRI